MKKHCCTGNHLFLFVLHNNSADNHDNDFYGHNGVVHR